VKPRYVFVVTGNEVPDKTNLPFCGIADELPSEGIDIARILFLPPLRGGSRIRDHTKLVY
jgi:hypothetical protein